MKNMSKNIGKFLEEQEPLGAEFSKVLNDNLWQLYVEDNMNYDDDNQAFYFVIFPGGDQSQIKVLELYDSNLYEKSEYLMASRNQYTDLQRAIKYARELSQKYGKTYIPYNEEDKQEGSYLD